MPGTAKNTSLTSIVAVGLDGAIGIENRLPWRLRSDLRFFKETTKNNIIIMGRKTYDSVGGCLPLRENIVLSHTPKLFPKHEGCSHVHSIAETLFLRERWKAKEAFVIGGAQIYKQFAPLVDRYLVTVVHGKFPEADAHFDESIFGDAAIWEKTELNVNRVEKEGADEFDFQVFEFRHRNFEEIAAKRFSILQEFHDRNHLLRRKVSSRGQAVAKRPIEARKFA